MMIDSTNGFSIFQSQHHIFNLNHKTNKKIESFLNLDSKRQRQSDSGSNIGIPLVNRKSFQRNPFLVNKSILKAMSNYYSPDKYTDDDSYDTLIAHQSMTKKISGCIRDTFMLNRNQHSEKIILNGHSRFRHAGENPLPYPTRFAILGGGSFGLALATLLGRKHIPVTLLVRKKEVVESINEKHFHPTYLPDIKLPPSIRATTDPKEALQDASYIIHAVPVQFSRKFLENIKDYIPASTPVISTSKGIETGTLAMMQDILIETLGTERDYGFLSGPSFAREIAQGLATAVVVASESEALANDISDTMASEQFRVFTSRDVVGVEVGGAVKNVLAIAAGMCEGLGLGTNAMAGLVTRGCYEMQKIAVSLGARPSTLMGLSGVGDTFGTCFGPLSRNRNLGVRLGKGEKLDDILGSSTEVAEGAATALSLVQLILKSNRSYRKDLKFPIIFGVAEILEGKRTPREGLLDLMNIPLKAEVYD